jgi:Tfp pilus assembly protein PilN
MSSLSYKTNFLPLELQSAGLHKIRSIAVAAAFLAVALLGGCWVFADKCAAIQQELAVVQRELTQMESAYRSTENIKKESAAAEELRQQYTEIISQKRHWSEILLELNRIAPDGLWLVELETSNQQENTDPADTDAGKQSLEASGAPENSDATEALRTLETSGESMIMKGCTEELSAVGILILELNKLHYFQTVTLDQVTTESEVMSFQITASLQGVTNNEDHR